MATLAACNVALFVFVAALGWTALGVTGATSGVGLVFAAYGAPSLVLTAYGGVLADRLGPRLVLGSCLVAMGTSIAALGLLQAAGWLSVVPLLAVAALIGCAAALGSASSQSIAAELVHEGMMASAVALNFMQIAGGRLLGGLAGGLIVAATPAGVAFVAAGTVTLLGGVEILRLRLNRASGRALPARRPLRQAWDYISRHPEVGLLIGLGAVPGMTANLYVSLLPAVARDAYGMGPAGLGILLAGWGAGSLVGAFAIVKANRSLPGGAAALAAGLALAGALVLFGLTSDVRLGVLLLLVGGAAAAVYAGVTLVVIQSVVPRCLRSRMVGIFVLLFWGTLPVASLLGGWTADIVGPRAVFSVAGVVTGLTLIAGFGWRSAVVANGADTSTGAAPGAMPPGDVDSSDSNVTAGSHDPSSI